MRIFENTKEAYPEILRDIIKFGRLVKSNTVQNLKDVSDDYLMKELQLYSFCVLSMADSLETTKDPDWVKVEISERLKKGNPGVAWKLREEYWTQFQDAEGKFCYTYGDRLSPNIPGIISLLTTNPGTRQAILALWQEGDHQVVNGVKRVPCTMYYNFQIREGKLDVIYHMRSSDFFEHFRNDLTLASLLRDHIGGALGVESGKTFMVVDSLHAYKKDWGKLDIY